MKSYYLEKIKQLKIMDDDFARIVFKDKDSSLEVLKSLGIISQDEVTHHETQYDIKNPNQRSIVLDIYVITDKKHIDIEIENNRSRASAKRGRLHVSEIDVHLTLPNDDFEKLPDVIVVFICNFDPFNKSLPVYTVTRTIEETNEKYNDGTKIIYVNGTYDGDDEIGRLVHDLKCTDPSLMYNETLRKRVQYFKESKGGIESMCEIWEEIMAKGLEKGLNEGLAKGLEKGMAKGEQTGKYNSNISSLVSVMKKLNVDLKEAMDIIGLDESEYDLYASAILSR